MNKYSKSNQKSVEKTTIRMTLRLSKNIQGDVIEKLDSLGNKRTAYIVELIRKDIASEKGKEK